MNLNLCTLILDIGVTLNFVIIPNHMRCAGVQVKTLSVKTEKNFFCE